MTTGRMTAGPEHERGPEQRGLLHRALSVYAPRAGRLAYEGARHAAWKLRGLVQTDMVVQTKQGRFNVLTRDQAIARILYQSGEYEFSESLRILDFLRRRGLVDERPIALIDAGANIGVIHIGLLNAGVVQRAIAIEPEPTNFRLLRSNVEENGLADRVTCINCAVSDRRTTVTMEIAPSNLGDHRVRAASPATTLEKHGESSRATISIPAVPIDDILAMDEVVWLDDKYQILLWMDVQGFEGYALRGASTLLQGGSTVVAEIWPYGLLRAGMATAEFSSIVQAIWPYYWIQRGGGFVRYPTSVFDCFMDELGNSGRYENVIFGKE